MNKRQWVQRRRKSWQRFQELVDRLQRVTLRSLPPKEVSEFSRLFRELSSDLALVRSRQWGEQTAAYLNDLVARGHAAFYRAPPDTWSAVARFLLVGYPRLFRANLRYFVVATVLFFGPLVSTWLVVQNDPSLAGRLLPADQLENYAEMYDREKNPAGGLDETRSAMGGFYVYNNVGIALRTYALGLGFGVGTVYVLLANGLTIGAVGGYVVGQGHGLAFTSFVVGHGSFELTAIVVAGGGGLMLADALLHPGTRTRKESLKVRGLESVKIAAGAAVMLVVAAAIEAFWSPLGIPPLVKYLVGAALWLLVALYLFASGRDGEQRS